MSTHPSLVASHQRQGFTLVSLMVTLSVIAILATIALPGLGGIVQRNTLTAETNNFVAGINFARTEAVTRGRSVFLCASDDLENCNSDPNSDWESGWIVYLSTGRVLKAFNLDGNNLDITANGTGALSFNSSGFAVSGRTFTVSTADAKETRRVVVAPSGRVRTEDA